MQVYIEIGILAGFLLKTDMIKNWGIEYKNSGCNANIEEESNYCIDVISKMATDGSGGPILNRLLENDLDYQEKLKEEMKMEKILDEISFTEDQKNIITTMFKKRHDTEDRCRLNSYRAGLFDAYYNRLEVNVDKIKAFISFKRIDLGR